MKNLEQKLAKKLLTDYKVCIDILENYRQSQVEKSFLKGEISVLMNIAHSIWGSDELDLRSHFWFLETLKEIADSEPQANLVEVSRFEAFAMFKDYGVKSVNARHEGLEGLADTYSERSDKWLDIATKIEQTNADGFNEDLMHI